MSESRAARALMGLGVTVGVVAASLGVLDLQLNFPDWLIRVAMIKLGFIAAGGLLAGGALLARHARSRSLTAVAAHQLPEGGADPIPRDRERARSGIEPESDSTS
ncbi:MAG TPA: hypothetical protein VFZ73_06630 [Gemmatimonadaceae bacterium]